MAAAAASEVVPDEKNDNISLAHHQKVQQMLAKNGTNVPKKEVVMFSDFVVKINKREKEQTRVLLITDKAVYNLLPKDYGKCKRRIGIDTLTSISSSSSTDEFVLHVADEYDYRFKSVKKKEIFKILKALYKQTQASKPEAERLKLVVAVTDEDLKDVTMTKGMARMQTYEDKLRRRQALLAERAKADSDDDEKKDTADAHQMLDDTDEKVKLDDFELLKVLGRGSFGKVMQVRKKDTGKIYAMKILKKKAIIERNQVEHTKAERKILQEASDHPFLMTLRYAFQSKEKLYFVLDYYQGGELFFHLKHKRRFPEDVARIYVAEIALALGHLHSFGTIYRDLKPENILLDEIGHVCLTDFGLAKDVAPDDQAHTFCGTPEYLAPEIVTGVGHNKAVDWWSLGILLYELTVGIPPFYSQNVNEMYNKIQHGVLRFPPFLTDDCKDLIVQLLHRDPTKRLGSKNDITDIKAHAFFKVLDWEKLMKKQVEVGYKPQVSSADDTSNFDATFTNEKVMDSVVPQGALSKTLEQQSDFSGFTFQQKGGSGLDDDDD